MNKLRLSLVFDNNNRARGNKEELIQLYVRLNGKKRLFSTGEYVKKSQWDDRRKEVKNHGSQDEINESLQAMVNRVQKYRRDETSKGNVITLDCIKRHLENKDAEFSDFIDFCRTTLPKLRISKATKKSHTTLFNKLESFQPVIPFSSINEHFVKSFAQFFLESKNYNTKGKTVSESYVAGRMSIFNKYTNLAFKKGLMEQVHFDEIQLKVTHDEPDSLTFDEVMRIYEYRSQLKREKQRMIVDAFVYCCLGGGLRYSDVIGSSDPQDGLKVSEVKNICFQMYHDVIHKKTKKYHTRSIVPISDLFNGIPQKIIGRYLSGKTKDNLVFGKYSNTIANNLIRRVAKAVEIEKYIQFKTARHTFTTLCEEAGIQKEEISKMVGHTSTKTTDIYSHTSIQYLSNKIRKAFH